jgi:hydrogenase maturation protease
MIKVIGIGNLLMGDDGIALRVIDYIKEDLENLNLGIKSIKSETDFNFALDNIDNGDFIFIIDGTLLDIDCGQITQISLEKVDKYLNHSFFSHNISLLWLINNLGLQVSGLIIGIEVLKVDFSLEISKELEIKFCEICSKIYKIIKEKSLEYVKKGESSA